MASVTDMYRKLKNNSVSKTLEQNGKEVFEDLIREKLTREMHRIDSDSYVTVSWDISEGKETKRSYSADYSIDIEAEGAIVSFIGEARVTESEQYTIITDSYRVSETGNESDYLDNVSVSSHKKEEVVNRFVDKAVKTFKYSLEEE